MTQINKHIKKERKGKDKGCCGIPGIPDPRFLKAFSDSTRLRILTHLVEAKESLMVSEIAKNFPIDVSVVSRHLAILRDEGGFASAIESCCPSKEKRKKSEKLEKRRKFYES